MAYLGGPGSCPPGFYWDQLTSTCQPITGVTGILDCPPGYYFDVNNNVCLPIGTIYQPGVTVNLPTPIRSITRPAPGTPAVSPVPARTPPAGGFVQTPPPSGQAAPWPPTGPINIWGPPPIPVEGTPPTVVSGGGTTVVPTGPLSGVIVNVDQSVSIADNSAANAVQNVANAVEAAIQAAAGLSQAGQQNVQSALLDELSTLTGAVSQGIGLASSSLQNVVSGIESGIAGSLGGLGSAIGGQIFNAINPTTVALGTIAIEISRQIGGLAGAIASAAANIIPLIVEAVTGSLRPIQATLAEIEDVLSEKLGGLVTAAGTIASTIGGIGTTLDGVLLHYEQWNQAFVESQTGYPEGGTLHKDLSGLASALAGIVSYFPGQAAVHLTDYLTYPCPDTFGQEVLHTEFTPPSEPLAALAWPWQAIVKFVGWFAKAFPALRKIDQLGEQALNQNCQTELLPPNTLVEAVLRGFLPYDQALKEAERGNLNFDRFNLLSNLATQQLSQALLTEARYRQIIPDADFRSAMSAQGYTPPQIDTLVALSVERLSVSYLWSLRRRGLIDESALKVALTALQYDAAQQEALSKLTFRPPETNEAIDGVASQAALQQIGLGDLASDTTVPEYVSVAGQAEGLDAEATALKWASHWNVGSIGSYITLYFRGLISIETLTAVMGKNFIPEQLVTTLVEAARPIVQYRTISNMLRIGQIDVQTAGKLLMQHGYSQENAQLLITYAQRPGASAAAKKAAALHAVSLGIAKREWIDGAISETDYYQILLEHGYTVEGADAEIAVERAQQAMLVRKENAQLVVDEYGAGIIDEKTALAALAALGLTVYEIAKYTHKIRVFRVKAAKHPTEAELNDFRKVGIITDAEYAIQVRLLGYTDEVAGWFTAWRTSTTQTSGSPRSTQPATTGGTASGPAPITS